MLKERGFIFIDEQSIENIESILTEFSQNGGGICVISSKVPRGITFDNIPDNVWLVDLRYGGFSIHKRKHPRQEGYWPQYSHLNTGLAKNITISDTISNHIRVENWRSEPHSVQPAPFGVNLSSEEYRHLHNHYQNLLCETFNFSKDINGISIWGDSAALYPGAKSWGGFFSARSWPVKWQGYTPEDCFNYDDKDFDAALVGVEIDVLNGGKPWEEDSPILNQSLPKFGLQIVGFGNKNTAAIEIRTEDSDDPTKTSETRRGAWHYGIIIRNALSKDSTLLFSENGEIKRGIDLSLTNFREGALLISSGGEKSGIVFDFGESGEIFANTNGELVVKAGKKGLRIEFPDGNFVKITESGDIEISEKLVLKFKEFIKKILLGD